jgi:hypothetical protein
MLLHFSFFRRAPDFERLPDIIRFNTMRGSTGVLPGRIHAETIAQRRQKVKVKRPT